MQIQVPRAVWRKQADLLAADTTTFAAVAAMHVHLAAQPFTPGLDLALGDLVEATFTGSAPKDAGIGTQPVFYDTIDGALTMQIEDPAGGWTWICTVTPVTPETIWGIFVTDNADAVLLGEGLLPGGPQTITAAGQAVIVGDIQMKWSEGSPS